MYKYTVSVSDELNAMLKRAAEDKNMTIEKFIEQILNKYVPIGHKIDHEAMARGYEEMAQINLELAK